MSNVLYQRTLGRSVNHHRIRVLLSGQSNFRIPLEFMTSGLLHCSINLPLRLERPQLHHLLTPTNAKECVGKVVT